MSTMTELDLSNNFGSSYNQMDHNVLTNSSRMSHDDHSEANVSSIRNEFKSRSTQIHLIPIISTKIYDSCNFNKNFFAY